MAAGNVAGGECGAQHSSRPGFRARTQAGTWAKPRHFSQKFPVSECLPSRDPGRSPGARGRGAGAGGPGTCCGRWQEGHAPSPPSGPRLQTQPRIPATRCAEASRRRRCDEDKVVSLSTSLRARSPRSLPPPGARVQGCPRAEGGGGRGQHSGRSAPPVVTAGLTGPSIQPQGHQR